MFGYIYIITNLLNGKKYVGKKKICKDHESYMGSSKWLKQDIKRLGKDNFKKEIIEYCKDFKELEVREIYYQKLWNVKESNEWYNLHIQNENWDTTGLRFTYSEERKKKIWPEERRKQMSERMKKCNINNFPGVSEAKSKRLKNNNPMQTPEAKAKIFEARCKTFYVQDPLGKIHEIKSYRKFFEQFNFDPGLLFKKGIILQGKNKGFKVISIIEPKGKQR